MAALSASLLQYEIFKAVRGLWQSELGVLVEHWAEQPFAVQDFLMGAQSACSDSGC